MIMIWAIAVLGAVSAFLFAFTLVPSKNMLAQRLDELSRPAEGPAERLVRFNKFFSDEQQNQLRRKLTEAGWYTMTPAAMVVRMIAGAVGGIALGLTMLVFFHTTDILYVSMAIILGACCAHLPLTLLNGAIKKRKTGVQRALPDLLDMLSTTVQAGLALNAALAYAVEAVAGPLREELQECLSEIRLGRPRADALKSMATRVQLEELSTTIRAIVQAERLGSNLSTVLEELSDDTRQRRLLRAEEIAAQLPVKMVIPMALFMLPALFVMIFGAVAADYFAR